jgi:hypothetical protein
MGREPEEWVKSENLAIDKVQHVVLLARGQARRVKNWVNPWRAFAFQGFFVL